MRAATGSVDVCQGCGHVKIGRWNHDRCLGQPFGPIGVPGASSEGWEEAPAQCDRCGGIWKTIEEGLACRTCPRRWVVATAVRALIRKGYVNEHRRDNVLSLRITAAKARAR